MSVVSFPGGGQDGEQPLPAVPARGEAGEAPASGGPSGVPVWDEEVPEEEPPPPDRASLPPDDWDADAYDAWFDAELAAGRVSVPAPEPWELEGPSATLSLPDACAHVDLAELAALVGPDRLAGEVFDQERVGQPMAPGPVLAAVVKSGGTQLGRLTDGQLVGMATAAGRVAAWAQWLQLAAVGEFTGRCQARAQGKKLPPGRGPAEFAAEELAMELVITRRAAADVMDLALDLDDRLPATSVGLKAGVVDGERAKIIGRYTRFLTDPDAATADEILAKAAPGLTYDQLARKALATAMRLDPEAMKRGKDEARRDRQRFEARREDSGNAALAGRELAVEDALASKAHIDALAVALRRGGLPGTLQNLRVLVFLDLLQGRNPQDRLTRPGSQAGQTDSRPGAGDDAPGGAAGDDEAGEDPGPASPSGAPGPFPALINLTIPAGTAFGWSHAPGDAAGWGLLDSADTRRLVTAAAQDPATRWCFTLLDADGTAAAHGCARGPHALTLPADGNARDGPAALAAFLRQANPTFTPIAKDGCDHAGAEHRYVPSRRLKHLVRARTATCPAPGCGAQACHNDLDHTIAYPAGLTCQCDLSPACRRHHRVKQAPGWHLEQPQPGIMRWTTPSGRSYTTRPTIYEM